MAKRKARNVNFRTLMGFTQDEYANYLGTTKAQVSQVDLQKRVLPGMAKIKDLAIMEKFKDFAKTWEPHTPGKKEMEAVKIEMRKKLHGILDQLDAIDQKNKKEIAKVEDEAIVTHRSYDFLYHEYELTTDMDEKEVIGIALGKLLKKRDKFSLQAKMNDSLKKRFLEFQRVEYQRCLEDLEAGRLEVSKPRWPFSILLEENTNLS